MSLPNKTLIIDNTSIGSDDGKVGINLSYKPTKTLEVGGDIKTTNLHLSSNIILGTEDSGTTDKVITSNGAQPVSWSPFTKPYYVGMKKNGVQSATLSNTKITGWVNSFPETGRYTSFVSDFDTSTGIWECPSNGIYFFNVSIRITPSSTGTMYIKLSDESDDGGTITYTLLSSSTTPTHSGTEVSLELNDMLEVLQAKKICITITTDGVISSGVETRFKITRVF